MNRNATILLVDDDVEFLRALNFALTRAGYTVVGATNPGAAMDYVVCDQHRFDLVITDLQMAGLNGLRVLQLLQQSFPGIPVIIVTGFGQLDSFAEAMRLGAVAYLNKPLDKDRFIGVVEQTLADAQKETQT
jgi:DNA-binding NtrC family response regulator